jgi:hypothetical protein
MAEENNQPPPVLTLNLPPGYLREYRRLYFQREALEGCEDRIMSGLVEIQQRRILGDQDSLV